MPAAKKKKPAEVREVKGYILPEKQKGDEEAEDSEEVNDEEQQQPEFLDMAEMERVSSGGHLFHSPVPLCNVTLQTLSGEEYQVEGRFALRGPWWEVMCSVENQHGWWVMKGFPSYRLRSDLNRKDSIHIVSLFLKACDVEPDYSKLFFDWLPPNRNVSIHNLMEVLDEFSKGQNKDQAKMITTRLLNSVAWMQVQASCLYPGVMKYLPRLLPTQFPQLLGIAKKQPTLPATQAGLSTQQDDVSQEEEVDTNLLFKIEQIIANDVWMLGFNSVVYRKLQLVRCEAQFKAFEDCSLLQKIAPLQRYSLMMYDRLKKHCYSEGSTYVDREQLCKTLRNNAKISDELAWAAINFLREQDVVVLDKGKVVLRNVHVYESGIAKCLRSLVESGPWNIPVNAVEVLEAASKEREWEKMQNSEKVTAHPVDGSPSVPEPTNTSDVFAHRKASPSVKSEVNIDQDQSSPPLEQQAETDSGLSSIKLDQDHIRAAEMICANPVTIISGKAGCGKTTVVSQLFSAAVLHGHYEQQDIQQACADYENDTGGSLGWEDPPVTPRPLSQPDEDKQRAIQSREEILLTAPTGRAASLLSKKTGFSAYTLHQVLYSFMRKRKDEQGCTIPWKFKDVRILVVDEGSMVSVQLLHSVLKMLTIHAELRKFIILGDVRQLPSIQPGNILYDLFDTLKRVGWAIEMKTNHRAESELIVENAGLIAEMGKTRSFAPLKFDAILDLDGPHDTLTADMKFIFIRLPSKESADDLQRAVKFLIEKAPGLNDHKTSQFITFTRNDVALINELCCKRYNNHLTKNHKKKLLFQPGDKVCCTKNGYLRNVKDSYDKNTVDQADVTNQTKTTKETTSLRLCNGEIFFITEDTTEETVKTRCRYVTLDDGDRVHTVDYRELQRECRLQHAWARTIHTFQGSENETIVYVVGDCWAQTWKHIYTAVTRGQKRVYVVSKEKSIKSAIERYDTPRNTRLASLVKEELIQPWMLVGTPQTQPNTPQGTPSGCSPQQGTPLHSQTPCRPSGSNFQSIPLQRKRLWKAEDEEEEAAAQSSTVNNSSSGLSGEQLAACEELKEDEQQNGAATSADNKRPRMLSAEH